jgi:hypothetical protein
MYTKAQAQTEIAKLVENFQASEARLKSEAEAQIENDYIRPLFRCLNWNTENAGLAVAEYEFVLQRTHRRGLRPDYILQLDGQQLLVMDAKQVKYSMHDPRWMNQVYAYAYSTQNLSPKRKIDFAILTDFQEFVVLDCTLYAATPTALGNFRVLDWHCADYVQQFDTLWELLERDNVRQAARTRGTAAPTGLWARLLSPQKVKANRIPPDKAFLAEMDDDQTGWRVRLAKDMKRLNPQADGLLLTAAVQLLIDRLIFVKVLSDREIEEDYLAQLAEKVERDGLAESDTGWFTACRAIFDQLNRFYNGSIFEPRPELEAVAVSNKVVRDILRALQPENSPYNFAVLPVEILGTIYERFLGRVVRTTDKQVKIEDKPEVRKAGGVYYTPQYIVDYIVQHTVGRLLAECRTPEDVARLKILDPACGSGSFLLGAYQALIDWHVRYYGDKERLTKRDRTIAYLDSDGRVRLTARLKRQILLHNLFGVDIDPQAVEVTRLSLSLKALEDTRHDELYDERTLFKQTVLPDLSGNVKCGNSLIGPDYFAGRMFPNADELRRVKPFEWAREFPPIMAAGGFDAVIGNPPYVFARDKGFTAEEKVYFANYRHHGYQLHTFTLFTEKGRNLLRRGGYLGYIIPSNWLSIGTLKPFRDFIVGSTGDVTIVNNTFKVFGAASVDTSILVFRKIQPTKVVLTESAEPGLVRDVAIVDAADVLADPIIQYRLYRSSEARGLLQHIESKTTQLGAISLVKAGLKAYETGKGRPPQTDAMKKGRVYHARERSDPSYRIYLDGKDVKRYHTAWSGQFLKYGANLAAPRDASLFQGERILVRQIPSQPPYSINATIVGDDELNDINSMIIRDARAYPLRYILGVLNSKLLTYWFQHRFDKLQRAIFPQFKVAELKTFPIRTINFADPADKARHDRMVQLVEAMLALHKHKAAARTKVEQDLYQHQIEATDRQIDALVYELYGLTAEEIAVVEGQG